MVHAFFHLANLTEQLVFLVQFAVAVGIRIDLEYRTCELVIGIVFIYLSQSDISRNKIIDKLYFHDLVYFTDCHADFFLGEYITFRASDFTDDPCAIRNFLKRKTAVIFGCGSRNRIFLCIFCCTCLKDAN